MLRNKQFEILISIFFVGLFLTFIPTIAGLFTWNVDNTARVPLTPEAEQLRTKILPLLTDEQSKVEARLLGSSVKSAANLFVLDEQRQKPYYQSIEAKKWAIKRTDELTFGLGFSLKDKNPQLAQMLKTYMVEKCGENPTAQTINLALLNLGLALESI